MCEVDSAFNLKIKRSRTRVEDWNRQVPNYALPSNDPKELELLMARFINQHNTGCIV